MQGETKGTYPLLPRVHIFLIFFPTSQISLLLRSLPKELIPNYHHVFYTVRICRVKRFFNFFMLILRSESVCAVILALLLRRREASQIISRQSAIITSCPRRSWRFFAAAMNLPIFFGESSPKGVSLSPFRLFLAVRGGFNCSKSNHSTKLSFLFFIDEILIFFAGTISVSISQSAKRTLPGMGSEACSFAGCCFFDRLTKKPFCVFWIIASDGS